MNFYYCAPKRNEEKRVKHTKNLNFPLERKSSLFVFQVISQKKLKLVSLTLTGSTQVQESNSQKNNLKSRTERDPSLSQFYTKHKIAFNWFIFIGLNTNSINYICSGRNKISSIFVENFNLTSWWLWFGPFKWIKRVTEFKHFLMTRHKHNFRVFKVPTGRTDNMWWRNHEKIEEKTLKSPFSRSEN